MFSAYRHEERNQIGRVIGQWLDANEDVEVVETIVTQSSGSGFHCLTITLLCAVVDGGRAAESIGSVARPSQGVGQSTDRDPTRPSVQSAVARLDGVRRDVSAVLSRVSSSSAAREVVGEMNVERLQDAATGIGAALEELSRA